MTLNAGNDPKTGEETAEQGTEGNNDGKPLVVDEESKEDESSHSEAEESPTGGTQEQAITDMIHKLEQQRNTIDM